MAMMLAATPVPTNSVFDLAIQGGVMMIPIALCSLIVVAVVAERFTVLRMRRVVPPKIRKGLRSAVEKGGQQGISDLRAITAKRNNPAARLLDAGVAKLGHTTELIEKHMGAAGEKEVYTLRRGLRVLTVVAAVAPLLGLTGTIFGMIRSFQTVAASGDNLGKAELLAAGIYEAMVTTAAGLLVAMPTVVFVHWFAGKIERLARELDGLAVEFVEAFVLEAPAPVVFRSKPAAIADVAASNENGVLAESAVGSVADD
ncbi:MAG: MotA/TolQ/ExbB proton channel family protein [Planctomycetota bacterium]